MAFPLKTSAHENLSMLTIVQPTKAQNGLVVKDYCYWGRDPSSWEVLGLQPLSNCSTDTDEIFHRREALLFPNKNVKKKTSDILHFDLCPLWTGLPCFIPVSRVNHE